MSLPCSVQDCFMCQLENKEIKETFRFDTDRDKKQQKSKYQTSKILWVINIAILIVFLLLIINLCFNRKKS